MKIWNRDQKQFSIRNQNFAVAQLETAALEQLPDKTLDAFCDLVSQDREQHGRLLSMLVLTDVLKGNSWMFSSESADAEGVIETTFSRFVRQAKMDFRTGNCFQEETDCTANHATAGDLIRRSYKRQNRHVQGNDGRRLKQERNRSTEKIKPSESGSKHDLGTGIRAFKTRSGVTFSKDGADE